MSEDEDSTVIAGINENNNANTKVYTNTNTDTILPSDNNRKWKSDNQAEIDELTTQIQTANNTHY